LQGADAGDFRGAVGQFAAPGLESGEDGGGGFQRVNAGLPLCGVGGAAGDLDLQVQAAVMGLDDLVREAGGQSEVGFGDALFEQIVRADLAAGFLVVGDMQFERAGGQAGFLSASLA